jgi:plastocyanin
MTTDTTEVETPQPPADEDATPALPARPNFWHRPNVERYIVPFVLPLMIVVALIAFVLSISRIFLSGHGNAPVVVGSAILLTILIGAAVLSAAPSMRSVSVALIGAAFFMAILFAGWLSLGHSELKEEGGEALPPEGPAKAELEFEATDGLVFIPDTAAAETGIYRITLVDVGNEHTFKFDSAETLMPELIVSKPGDIQSARAFFGDPGDYTFFCSIPGHRAAGMEGVITVTGDPTTLEAAQLEVGDTGEAAPEGAAPGGEGGATTETSAAG